MSLPTLSTLNTTQDTNKQLAIIRSYLIQLKDELEAELSNVTYDMLSASLQKRIDAISEDITVQKEEQFISAQMIKADSAKIGSISADYVKASTLSTAIINTGVLNAYMAKATYLTADEAYIKQEKVEDLSALSATVNTIKSNYITAGYINATNINSVISTITSMSVQNIHVRDGLWMKQNTDPTKETLFTSCIRMAVGGAQRWVICTSG